MPEPFHNYLKHRLTTVGMTMAEASLQSGVPQSSMRRWAQRMPSVSHLRLLAPVIEVRLIELLVRSGHITAEEGGITLPPEPEPHKLPTRTKGENPKAPKLTWEQQKRQWIDAQIAKIGPPSPDVAQLLVRILDCDRYRPTPGVDEGSASALVDAPATARLSRGSCRDPQIR